MDNAPLANMKGIEGNGLVPRLSLLCTQL